MDTWTVYKINQYGSPKIESRDIIAYDITSAVTSSGWNTNEIICVKLKLIEKVVGGV